MTKAKFISYYIKGYKGVMGKDSIGEKIKNLRKINKLSQEEFAEQLEVSRQTVYLWEAGKAVPDCNKLSLICNKFKIDANDFLCVYECLCDAASQDTFFKKDQKQEEIAKDKLHSVKRLKTAIIISASVMLTIMLLLLIATFCLTENVAGLTQAVSYALNIQAKFFTALFSVLLALAVVVSLVGFIMLKKIKA